MTVFDDRAGVEESTVQAGAWLRENGYTLVAGAPVAATGKIEVAVRS